MPSPELQRVADLLREQRAARQAGPPDFVLMRAGFEAAAPPPPADAAVVATSAGGVPTDWVSAPGADASRRVLYLHGGVYILGSVRAYRRLAADISRATGCAVLNLDYRLAPEAPFPAALEDALAAYRWMLANGPEGPAPATDAFVGGDSAGGGLTLATMIAARDSGERLPNAAFTVSAWTDLAGTGPSLETRARVDPIVGRGGGEAIRQAARPYLGTSDPRTPLASPLYADLHGLPPLLMQVGDYEVLLDDTLRLADRARAQAVEVSVHVGPEAFHIFPFYAPDAPESRCALEQIGGFVKAHQTVRSH